MLAYSAQPTPASPEQPICLTTRAELGVDVHPNVLGLDGAVQTNF